MDKNLKLGKRKKILVPIFNRAPYGRLRPVLEAIKNHPQLELQLAVGLPAAHEEFWLNIKHSRPYSWRLALPWYLVARFRSILDFFKPGAVLKNNFLAQNIIKDGFKIDGKISLFLDGGTSETMAKSVGLGILKIVDELRRLKPDVVFVNADRFEMMAVAVAAAYLNIPIAHNEGGDVSGTIDESIRHAITKLSHIHFVATEASRKRVLQMGENPKSVFVVGSPAIDALKNLNLNSFSQEFLNKFNPAKPYLLMLLHPVATESGEQNSQTVKNLIKAIEALKMPTVLLGSNIDSGSDEVGKEIRKWYAEKNPDFVYFTKHLPPDDFYRLLAKASCAVGNSSSFIRESAFFGTPAVIVGSRQQNRDRGRNVIEVSIEPEKIQSAVNQQIKHGRYSSDQLFGDGKSSIKIAEILANFNPGIQKQFHEL